MDSEFNVYARWEDFLKWLLPVTGAFPKKIRFTITTRIDNLALDILETIVVCRYNRDSRAKGLTRINLDIEKLRVFFRICHEMKYISHRQYQFAVLHINETGKMVWGWLKDKESHETVR